jgi:mono/diheme cytochrome c family protein
VRAARTVPLTLLAALALAFAGCGGDDDDDEAGATTGGGGATATETAGGGEADGAAVFAEAGCGGCHVLEAAGSSGQTGPNLDDLMPSKEQVEEQVRNGGGGMPAFDDQLSDEEIDAVATYVSESAGG